MNYHFLALIVSLSLASALTLESVPPRVPVSRRQAIGSISLLAAGYALPQKTFAYTPDSDPLRESLYLISRVQEATVQQERFVRKSSNGQELKNKMKLTLKLIEKNYRLVDQITFCSTYISPDNLVAASAAGNEASESLQDAIDFVRNDMQPGTLDDKTKDYLTNLLSNAREQIFAFLDFVPQDKLEQARKRVEQENVDNREEYDGDGTEGVYNPVVLPWKN